MIPQIEPWITPKDQDLVNLYLKSGGWITEHKTTNIFEAEIASYVGSRYATMVPSGTTALYLALEALELRRKRVIVPNYTMIATINAVIAAGAQPIVADVDPKSFCLDLKKLEPCDAVIYVAINGRSDGLEKLAKKCKSSNTYLIEDACQAFGSKTDKEKYVGTIGDIGVYSFTPHKIITTGQGGAIVTNNKEVTKAIRQLKDFGRVEPGVDLHTAFGMNYKFTDLQASLGISQLSTIEVRTSIKRDILRRYRSNLKDTRFEIPEGNCEGYVPWFVEILCKDKTDRDYVGQVLKGKQIGSRPFYPILSTQPVFSGLNGSYLPQTNGLSNSKNISERGLWLPSSCCLEKEEIDSVCEVLKKL